MDCFKSNGKEITEQRNLEAFTALEAYDNIEVYVFQGPNYSVEVTAGENIIKHISTKVEGGVLKLDNNNKCNFVRGYKRKIKIKVVTPYLEKAINQGVGPITFAADFAQDQLFVRAENSGDIYVNGNYKELSTSSHGNGDMYLKGTTERLFIYSNGTNYTWADEMVVKDYIFISTFSIGDAYFNLEGVGLMEYLIWSSGNIYYKGSANQLRDLSETEAKGKAIQKD